MVLLPLIILFLQGRICTSVCVCVIWLTNFMMHMLQAPAESPNLLFLFSSFPYRLKCTILNGYIFSKAIFFKTNMCQCTYNGLPIADNLLQVQSFHINYASQSFTVHMSAVPLLEQRLNMQLQRKHAHTCNMSHTVVLYYSSTGIWLMLQCVLKMFLNSIRLS